MNHEFPGYISQIKGQFILTAEDREAPEGWSCRKYSKWKLFTSVLPIADVFDEFDKWLGWCIGYPIVGGVIEPEKIVLKINPEDIFGSIEEFYYRATGRWALLLVTQDVERVFLDPYGSLAIAYSTIEKTLASTPTLIGSENDWDKEFMKEVGFPEKISWLPCGLTFKKNVSRLLPNHSLHLGEWNVKRHWPTDKSDFSIVDLNYAQAKITTNCKNTFAAISKKYPICLTLTAGMDSRMVLAMAREYVDKIEVVTFAEENETVDMYIASRLAKQLALNHKFLHKVGASPEELHKWQLLIGFSASGAIWKIHKTLEKLDSTRVLLPGVSAEVHKGKYWKRSDNLNTKLTASEILKRYNFPQHPRLVGAYEEWLLGLKFLNPFNLLDLVYIEQRLGCWAAPVFYNNQISKFELIVFNSRTICENMMRLPLKYRQKKQLVVDICKEEWPELLSLPFNDYAGLRSYLSLQSNKKRLKELLKSIIPT